MPRKAVSGLGRYLQFAKAEPVKMRQPRLRISEICLRLSHQTGDQRRGQGVLSHIAVSRLVEHVIGMASAQQVEEIQPAFRCAGSEPGEPVIADLRAKSVLADMPRTGIVDRHIRRCLQPGAQNVPASATKSACLSVSRRCNCRLEIATPTERRNVASRGSVDWP
jgi:hypothetical protein